MPGDLPSIVTLTLSGAGYFGSSAKPLELCSQRRAQEQSGLSGLAFRIRQAGREPCSARGELCATTAGGPSSGSAHRPCHWAVPSWAGGSEQSPCSAPCVSGTVNSRRLAGPLPSLRGPCLSYRSMPRGASTVPCPFCPLCPARRWLPSPGLPAPSLLLQELARRPP